MNNYSNWQSDAEAGSAKWEDTRDFLKTCEELQIQPVQFLEWINSGSNFLDAGCGKGELLTDLNGISTSAINGCDILINSSDNRIIKGFFNKIPYSDGEFDRILCLASIGTYAPNYLSFVQDIHQLSRITTKNGEVIMFLNPLTFDTLLSGFMFNPAAMFAAGAERKKATESPLDATYFKIDDFRKNPNFNIPLLSMLRDYGFEVTDKWVAGHDWIELKQGQRTHRKPTNLGVRLTKVRDYDKMKHIFYENKARLSDLAVLGMQELMKRL